MVLCSLPVGILNIGQISAEIHFKRFGLNNLAQLAA